MEGMLHTSYSDSYDVTDVINVYNSDAQFVQAIAKPSMSDYRYLNVFATDNNDILVIGYGWIDGAYSFTISRFNAVQGQYDTPIALPYILVSAKYKFHKNAFYFTGCFDPYGNGQLQFGDIRLVSSDATASYHTEGYLVKYDLISNQFAWGKTIPTMNCGFDHLIETSVTDKVYLSTEKVGINSSNYIRAYSTAGDSLWTLTTGAYIISHKGLGSDRNGNVYVAGTVDNGAGSRVSFGKVAAFTYDYTVGFLVKIAPVPADGPVITSKSPAPGEIAVSVSRPLQLTFSKPVYLGNGKLNIFNATTQATIRSLTLSTTYATVKDNQVTFNLPSSLPVGTKVYVQLDNNTFTDLQGKSFGGILDKSWTFLTAGGSDKTPPTIVSTTPASSATNVDVNTTLVLNFSENITTGTGSVYLYDAADDALVMTIPINSSNTTLSGSTATVVLPDALPSGKTLYAHTDQNVFRDGAANPFAGISDQHWTFTTVAPPDTQPPTIVSTSPAPGAVDIATTTTLLLNFSENILLGTGSFNIYSAADDALVMTIPINSSNTTLSGSTATVALTIPLPAGNTLYVNVDANVFTDSAANGFAGIADKHWSFTTIPAPDTQSPTLASTYPANDAVDVTTSTVLMLTFKEDVVLNTGNLNVFNFMTDAQICSIPLSATNTTLAGNRVTITPNPSLPGNVKLYITTDNAMFSDKAGNHFAGMPAKHWYFTTLADPVVTAIEGDPFQDFLTVQDEGEQVRITTTNPGVIVLGISDVLGRNIAFYESDHGFVFSKPAGVFIIQGKANTERYALKFFLR